ncbi:hypothetical protein NKH18_46590 [Streptomyces sp. M10(2022)]
MRGESWDERQTSLVLPSPTALAATWDEPLITELGVLLAAEARGKGSTYSWHRHSICTGPRWADGTSSASRRTRCSPGGPAPP